MDKKKLFFYIGCLLALISVSSVYWGSGQEDEISRLLVWFVAPGMGVLQLYFYGFGKRMSVGLISAEPEEIDKRNLLLMLAIFLVLLPLLVAFSNLKG